MQTIFGDITLDQVTDAKMVRVLKQDAHELEDVIALIKKGDICVDAGAYIGVFSVAATTRGGVVHAFEPNPEPRERLHKNAAGRQITVYPFGLGANPSRASVLRNESNLSNSTLIEGDDVEVKRLDSVVPRADFIKIDVEGMEPEVLEGAQSLRPHSMYIEVFEKMLNQHGHSVHELEKYLSRYKKYVFFRGGWYKVPSLSLLVLVLNPGRFIGHNAVLNVLATTRPFRARSFFSLIRKKLTPRLA